MFQYNDGLCPGGRRPRLYLAKGGEVRKFAGENIPGFCAIAAQKYEKNGKWSSTTYQLELAPGVRPLEFLSPLHGTWGDGFTSWGEVAGELQLPIEVAQALVRAEYTKTGERLDKLEAFAASVEAAGGDTEVVVISFGSPTNRQAREGFWNSPKSARASDGTEVTVAPGTMPPEEATRRAEEWGRTCGYAPNSTEVSEFQARLASDVSWDFPRVLAPSGAKVLSSKAKPGMHGGYRTVEVAVPVR